MTLALGSMAACSSAPAPRKDGGADAGRDVATPPDGRALDRDEEDAPVEGPALEVSASDGFRDALSGDTSSSDASVERYTVDALWTSDVLASNVCSDAGWCWSNTDRQSDGGTRPNPTELGGVWGSGPDDVWAVGDNTPDAFAIRWNGATWSEAIVATASSPPNPEPGEVEHLSGVWGSGPDDVWAVGSLGYGDEIVHWDGVGWASFKTNTAGHLFAVWGSGPSDAWTVGGVSGVGKILRWDGARWSPETSGLTQLQIFGQEFHAVWGTGPSDVWTVGIQSSILHWSGAAWTPKDPGAPGTSGGDLYGIWGSAVDDVWAVGARGPNGDQGGTILHWNGSSWSEAQVDGLPALYAVWGNGPADVTAVGGDGVSLENLARWNGHVWSVSSTGTPQILRGVWGAGADDMFVVGDDGIILHR